MKNEGSIPKLHTFIPWIAGHAQVMTLRWILYAAYITPILRAGNFVNQLVSLFVPIICINVHIMLRISPTFNSLCGIILGVINEYENYTAPLTFLLFGYLRNHGKNQFKLNHQLNQQFYQ